MYEAWKREQAPLIEQISRIDIRITALRKDKNSRTDLKAAVSQKSKLENKLKEIGIVEKPRIHIEMDGIKIAKELVKRRDWIEMSVKKMNQKRPSTEELRLFINQCKIILESASHFFNKHNFFSAIGYDIGTVVRDDYETTRFKLPIQEIFDTGTNIMVLGEAGAGKTTSLQMYAFKRNDSTESLSIFVSLSSVTQNWEKRSRELSVLEKVTSLDIAIAIYLEFKGVAITPMQFSAEINAKKTILLLDGIDEAIKLNPWLPEGIIHLANKYKNTVQLIVTSRMSGAYIDKIPFFSVTLLPFTTDQRNQFIQNWFENQDSRFVKRIIQHLKKNEGIAEIVKNPLLTTLLCVLAKNEVTLPNTELMLYDDRLQLLTGYYDSVKSIDTRIRSKPQILGLVAQKLAFKLHLEGKRQDDKFALEKHAISSTSNLLTAEEARLAVFELIDPCNVLIPMTDDGKFGFGHLKFQEHLAAREVHRNRNIDIVPLLKENWWRGIFVFYAQMEPDLNWLIMEIASRGQITSSKNTLFEMFSYLPGEFKNNFFKMVNKLIDAEKGQLVSTYKTNGPGENLFFDEEWR